MSEDGISPLPAFSLGVSKEEAEGASVVVGFWPLWDRDTWQISQIWSHPADLTRPPG